MPDTEKKPKIVITQASYDDTPTLAKLNKAAYPAMAEENEVWNERHLASHIDIFAEGQLVAKIDDEIVGAVSTLIVDMGPDPLRLHTWYGITDSGYFYTHNPDADTLYGADVYVHPDSRGLGVGAALYKARRDLCRRLNLRRILAGGRIWGYRDYADKYTPDEYVERVIKGEIRDLVLSFQLREGFEVRRILPDYIPDPLSLRYATLVEWLNPDYRERGK